MDIAQRDFACIRIQNAALKQKKKLPAIHQFKKMHLFMLAAVHSSVNVKAVSLTLKKI